MMLTFADYQYYQSLFAVERDLAQRSITICEPLVIQALSVFVQPHLWRGELPVYLVMTTPQENGGWGHLMPFWFKPQDRPIPFYILNNWALFALVYAHSFGPSDEAAQLVKQLFTVENVVRVVVGTNLQLPFLPTTQGQGSFFRQGMLPFLLSILWLDEEICRGWLRLHQLGAECFIAAYGLATCADPMAVLTEMEYTIFSGLERNSVNNDEAVATFLSSADNSTETTETLSLFNLYQKMFGAINLGITALATYYHDRPLAAWPAWIMQELIMPYRLPDYGREAIRRLLTS